MRFNKVLCVLYLIHFAYYSSGQELTPVFENITDGLPSTEVHDMFQDSVGYMWFATDRGICKYNGDRFQQIEIESYLKTKVVFKFFKEKENKIWIVSGKKRLYWFNPFEVKPRFHEFLYNDEIQEIFSNSIYNRNITNIIFEKNGFIVLFKNAPGYISVNYQSGCKLVNGQNESKFLSKFNSCSFLLNQEPLFHYISFINLNESVKKERYIQMNSQIINIKNIINFGSTSYFGVSCELKTTDTRIIAISDILILEKDKQLISKKLKSKIICLFQSEKKILVGTYNGVYELNSNLEITNFFLSEYAITKIFVDKTNNLWISTLQSGVFLFKQNRIQQIKFEAIFNLKKIIKVSSNLIISDDINNSCIIINQDEKIIGQFNDCSIRGNNFRFANNTINNKIISILNLKPRTENLKKTFHSFTFYSNSTFSASRGLVWEQKNDFNDYLFYQNEHHQYVNFCFQISPNTLFIGYEKGCELLDIKTKKPFQKSIRNSKDKSINTAITLNNQIILGANDGFYLFINNELRKIHLKKEDNIIGTFKVDENNAWAYSEKSIYQISLKNQTPIISEFAFTIGKQNTVILSVVEFNNKLWILTKEGLFISKIKNADAKSNQKNLKFIVDSILIGKKKVSSFEHTNLYSEDKIQLFFNTISYDRSYNSILEYSLDGENWYETNKNSLVLGGLVYGKNILTIRLKDNPDFTVFKKNLFISKHYYQTLWFEIVVGLLLFSIVVLIILSSLKFIDSKRKKELHKLTLELKLLTSKMNPHFTFNTINSIQHFILKNDKKEAIIYLSDFALLMRKNLEFSMEERITLAQEKEFIQLYVQLENKRFSSNFKLNFNIKPSEMISTLKIPSMLIQPLIENVILHANYRDDEEKLINVTISHDKGYFTVKVVDFGAGFMDKSDLTEHKSFGLEIIKSRIKLYNGKEYLEDDIKLSPTTPAKKGITVTLKLKEWKQ